PSRGSVLGARPPTGETTQTTAARASARDREVCDLEAAMAEREDLEFTYSLIDRIVRLSLGELADFSGAKYDGDFSLTLEQAQRRKHEYIADQIGIEAGRRVLDLGCGWGPLLNFIRDRGGSGV